MYSFMNEMRSENKSQNERNAEIDNQITGIDTRLRTV